MSNTIDMAAIQSVTLGGGGLTTLAAAVAALPPTGGKITVAPNYTETLSADISIAMPDVNIEFMGPATITMGSHVIKTPAGLSYPSVSGFSITGPMRGSRDTPLPSFIYTGAGTAIQVGAADRAVFGVRLAGFAVDLQGAGDAAIGVGLKQVQYVTADRVAVRGHSGAGRTQKGFYLDGNGTDTNFSAYQVFKDCSVYGVQIGYDVDGPAFGNNANMWIGGDVSTNTTDGNAVYIRTGDTNNLIGTDLFANNIGVRFGGNAADNHSEQIRVEGIPMMSNGLGRTHLYRVYKSEPN